VAVSVGEIIEAVRNQPGSPWEKIEAKPAAGGEAVGMDAIRWSDEHAARPAGFTSLPGAFLEPSLKRQAPLVLVLMTMRRDDLIGAVHP